MITRSNRKWIACCCAALVLVVITFTPLVIPYGIYKPMLWGIPYTLWTGVFCTIAFVILTLIATRVHPARENEAVKQ
ncbi:MAG: hypothetical protein H6696_06430 [Deferribacteres bacterium]|nr:hypothetical protein [candidate division KSB1 bacterium]MCB9501556.1 hypothetical protein [Deferribacteres bacterium]